MCRLLCITCHRYDADGFVSDVVLVQDFIESFLVQEELVRLALIVNLHNLYRLPHDKAVRISEISKVRQRSIHSFQIGSISNDACGLWIGSQFPVFGLQRTGASYF